MADYTICGVVWSPGIDVMVSMFDIGRQFDQRTAASVFGSLADARQDFGVERIYSSRPISTGACDKRGARSSEVKKQLLHTGHQGRRRAAHQVADRQQVRPPAPPGEHRRVRGDGGRGLGVTNTIMASIRSRRWQFGILRSIGVTRGQLLRLVLSEASCSDSSPSPSAWPPAS